MRNGILVCPNHRCASFDGQRSGTEGEIFYRNRNSLILPRRDCGLLQSRLLRGWLLIGIASPAINIIYAQRYQDNYYHSCDYLTHIACVKACYSYITKLLRQ